MRSLWTLFTLQDTGYIDQFWNGSLIAPVSFSGWDIHTEWPRGHLAQWGQSTSTRVREKVYIYSIFHVNFRFLPPLSLKCPFSSNYELSKYFQRISWSLLQSFSCMEALLRVNTDNSEGKWTQRASCRYVYLYCTRTTTLLSRYLLLVLTLYWDGIFYRADWRHLIFNSDNQFCPIWVYLNV